MARFEAEKTNRLLFLFWGFALAYIAFCTVIAPFYLAPMLEKHKDGSDLPWPPRFVEKETVLGAERVGKTEPGVFKDEPSEHSSEEMEFLEGKSAEDAQREMEDFTRRAKEKEIDELQQELKELLLRMKDFNEGMKTLRKSFEDLQNAAKEERRKP